MRAANWLVSMIKRTFTDSATPAPDAAGDSSAESEIEKKQEVKQEKRQSGKSAFKKEAKMTNPHKDSHLDSLLGEFGLPVEVQAAGANDEPAEPEVAEVIHENVTFGRVSVVTSVEGAQGVASGGVEVVAGAPAGEDSALSEDDRRRRRRRRRRGDEAPEGREPRENRPRRDRRRDNEDEDQDGPREMDDDNEEVVPEEPFVLEDLSSLQFPAWEDLVGGLFRPHDHR